MKVKIQPIIDRDASGRVNVPISNFRVIENEGTMTENAHVSAVDMTTTEGKILAKMQNHSITPTTFASREFENNLDEPWHLEQYQYKEHEVARFGINNNSSTIIPQLITDNIKTIVDGRGSSKYSKQPQAASAIKLSSLECLLLDKAINYLLAVEEHNVILLDILERVNGGNNNGEVMLEEGLPKIHTVLLYKNPDIFGGPRKISVIDSSNFLFSSHLSNFNNPCYNQYKTYPADQFEIKTLHQGLKIYEPDPTNTGPAAQQYRNCTDILVKLAFGLNKLNMARTSSGEEKLLLLTLNAELEENVIKECSVIQNISNNRSIDKHIITSSNKQYVWTPRIKQTSNVTTVECFNKLEKSIKIEHEAIEALTDKESSIIRQRAIMNILSTTNLDGHKAMLVNLYDHHMQCNEEFNAACGCIKLLAEIHEIEE